METAGLMLSRLSRSKQQDAKATDELGGMLGELSTNSPLRVMKHKKFGAAERGSPYKKNASRRSARVFNRLGFGSSSSSSENQPLGLMCDDGRQLLTPGRAHSGMFVADKHVTIRKDGGAHGITLKEEAHVGLVVSGIDREAQAYANGLLVGDIISAIEGESVTSPTQALFLLSEAQRTERNVTITAAGSSRSLTLDKRQGDLGMTCSAAAHTSRGVLLKRIAAGSLADKARDTSMTLPAPFHDTPMTLPPPFLRPSHEPPMTLP